MSLRKRTARSRGSEGGGVTVVPKRSHQLRGSKGGKKVGECGVGTQVHQGRSEVLEGLSANRPSTIDGASPIRRGRDSMVG